MLERLVVQALTGTLGLELRVYLVSEFVHLEEVGGFFLQLVDAIYYI